MYRFGNILLASVMCSVLIGFSGLFGGLSLINEAEANISKNQQSSNNGKKARLERQREQQRKARLERKWKQQKQARLERKRKQQKQARLERKRKQQKQARLERKREPQKQARLERKRKPQKHARLERKRKQQQQKQTRLKQQKTARYQAKKQPAKGSNSGNNRNNRSTANTNQASVEIYPGRDLGTNKGRVCFSVKAYTREAMSAQSQPVCTTLRNNKPFKLAWSHNAKNVIGYRIYRGNSPKKTNDYLFDPVKRLTNSVTGILSLLR